jgi:hypothetical protein
MLHTPVLQYGIDDDGLVTDEREYVVVRRFAIWWEEEEAEAGV